MECLQIKKLIESKNKELLLDKYIELINSKRIHPLTIKGIKRAIKEGHIVCLVTGRP